MYKETFFFNFRGILTSDKIAKNEKLQKTGFWYFRSQSQILHA